MEIFTHKNYLKYKEFLNQTKKNIVCQLKEENEAYDVKDKAVNNEHDKIFRRILDDKKEVAKFINKALKLEKQLTEKEIEKYNSSFITLELKNQECDVIYKMENQDVFFLIEHQTKIDYTMPLRILEYVVEIMKSAIDKDKLGKKEYRFPVVIPVVLYTGRKKWNVSNYIKEVQENLMGYEGVDFAKYNIVDINNYTEEELLQEENFLSKAMLIEKAKYTGNLVICLEKIVEEINIKKSVYTKEQRELLITIIELVLKRKLEDKESEKLIKSLKGEESQMLAVLEMIDEENKRIFRKGEKKGKIETAKKMLEKGIDIETVMEITGLKEKEIKSNSQTKTFVL